MSELSAYYENFRVYAACGSLHTARCRGWHLSEVDTWHSCGVCNRAGHNHPEDDRTGEEEVEARDSVGNIFGEVNLEVQAPVFTSDSDDLPF